MHRDVPGAQHSFEETIRLSKDPAVLALVAYLPRAHRRHSGRARPGRQRVPGAALTVRDGQADTRLAAEKAKAAVRRTQKEHTESQGDGIRRRKPHLINASCLYRVICQLPSRSSLK